MSDNNNNNNKLVRYGHTVLVDGLSAGGQTQIHVATSNYRGGPAESLFCAVCDAFEYTGAKPVASVELTILQEKE